MASKTVKNDIFFVMDFGCDFLGRCWASWDDLGAILGPLGAPRVPRSARADPKISVTARGAGGTSAQFLLPSNLLSKLLFYLHLQKGLDESS